MQHTLTEMGSAALAAAVPNSVRRLEFPTRDNEVLIKLAERTLKIPSLSHAIAWTHENTAHTDRNG